MKKYLLGFLAALLLACQPTPVPDTTPPAVPTAFKATAGNGAVKLEWTANTDSDLGQYQLFWSSNATLQSQKETITKTATQFELSGLTNATTYYFRLVALDTTGNTSSSTGVVSATPIAADITPPTLSSSLPALNASNVAPNTQVQLMFSEAMNPSTVTVTGNVTLGAASWNTSNTVVSFVTPALQLETIYTLQIAGKDVAGNNLAGATTLQFSTPSIPPVVSSTTPSSAAIGVSVGSKIVLRFSKTMNKNSVQSAFSSTPAVICTWLWTDSDQTATCTPSAALAFLTEYVIGLAATASSAANVPLLAAYSFKFTTARDLTQPALTGFTPTDTSTNVSYLSAITLSFSKPMNQSSVQNAFGATFNCTWTWATTQSASCQPTVPLEQFTAYRISLANSATDLSGNALQAAYGFTFTTGSAPPRIVSFSPNPRFGTNVAITAPIVLTFSEPMNKATTEVAMLVKIGAATKAGSLTWNPECVSNANPSLSFNNCTVLTYTPATPYPYGITVTWTLSTAATDLTSTPLAALVTQSFGVVSQTGP